MDPFLVRLLVGVLFYFLGNLFIVKFAGKRADIFETILLICVILYVVFGKFLPF